MIDRRTFLKLSAGALVLTAAGALTGCGTTIDLNHPQQEVEGVMFLCDVLSETDFPARAHQNSVQTLLRHLEPERRGCEHTSEGYHRYLYGKRRCAGEDGVSPRHVEVGAKQYQKFSRSTFGLETENNISSSHENTTLPTRQNGTYELRIKYKARPLCSSTMVRP